MTSEDAARWCDRYEMLPRGGRVLACVSGGTDSVCLLSVLVELKKKYGFELHACHFNHRLRGEESDGDELFVKKLCAGLGVELHVGSADVASEAKRLSLGTEDCARRLRYAFFAETAEKLGGARIATAHNADDNLETLLFRMARGTGLRGLGGIPPVRGDIIRPLLAFSRAEIEKYLAGRGIPHREDSTNAEDGYARNRLRHYAVPALKSVSPVCAEASVRLSEELREDEQYLHEQALAFLRENAAGENAVSAAALSAAPGPIASRAVRIMAGDGLGSVHVDAILRLAASGDPSGEVSVPGMIVRREYGSLVFGAGDARPVEETRLAIGETTPIGGTNLAASVSECIFSGRIHKSFTTFLFKKTAVCGSITARRRKTGDTIRLSGKGGVKTLKKLFIEKKIPADSRDGVPVLCDEKGVIAVYGIGSDLRTHAKPGDEVIKIKIEETRIC